MRTLHPDAAALPRPARRGPVLLLVLALLLAQALGLMHRTLHGNGKARVAAAAVVEVQAGRHGDQAHGWVASLFAGHASDADCRLFDPLNHEAPASVAAVALPVLLTSFFLLTSAGDFIARWAALFDARGPPASR